uniref:SEC13 homolog, nuclear pore and COPII coat complex component n=1 Tax=Oncorhynchus tshawytscha TaxID=74940 RepID=A0AAZ3RJ67_ONCTS
MDYYGTRLATCSSDRSILVADLRGHEGPVWQEAWAQKVIIWKEEERYLGQNSYEQAFFFFFKQSVNVTVCCNNPMSSLCPVRLAVNAVSWAPTVVPGGLIDQPSGQNPNCTKRFVSGGCDNLVKLWKEEDGQWKEDQKLEAHSDWVRDVGWAPSIGTTQGTSLLLSEKNSVVFDSGSSHTTNKLPKVNSSLVHSVNSNNLKKSVRFIYNRDVFALKCHFLNSNGVGHITTFYHLVRSVGTLVNGSLK